MSSDLVDRALLAGLQAERSATSMVVASGLAKFAILAGVDAESALVKARKILEIVLQASCRGASIPVGTKNLDRLRTDLCKAHRMPAVIERHCRVILDFGNLAAHEEDETGYEEASRFEFSTTEVEMTAKSLDTICRWFLDSVLPEVAGTASYRIVHGKDITADMLRVALAIDVGVYPLEFQSDEATCLAWQTRNPDIYTAIVDTRTEALVGYINAMPVTDECFTTLENDASNDAQIPLQAIRTYDLADFYKLHISSFALAQDYQATNAFRLLYEAFVSKLLDLARKEIFFTEVLAYALTDLGEKLAKHAGMKCIRTSKDGFRIYKMTLLPPSLRVTTTGAKNLTYFYQAKYEEFKDILR